MATAEAFALRSYQTNLLQEVFSAFALRKRRIFLQLPTGGGKTHCFSYLAREFLNQQQGVLVVAHRKELIDQAYQKLISISGFPATKITAGKQINPDYLIQIASIQTLRNRKYKPQAGLVIIDEAHHATSKSYTDLIAAYPEAYILGVSATPMRCDGQSLKRHFDTLITGPSVSELINQGYLSPFKLFGATKKISTDNIKTRGGDYDKKQLIHAVEKQVVCADVLENWQRYASGLQTVIFNVSVNYSQQIALTFNKAGIPTGHIDGKTPKAERDDLIQQFRERRIRVLSNCEIVTEGFDVPGMEAVQIVRPTQSLILWLQMVGRVLRPFAGKDSALIIDHTDNWKRLGLPDEKFHWSLEPISLKNTKYSFQCSECNHIFKPQPHETKMPAKVGINQETNKIREIYQAQCPNCLRPVDFEWSQKGDGGGGVRVVNEDENLELIEIPPGTQSWAILHFEQLLQIQQRAGYKLGWLNYKLEKTPFNPYFSLPTWLEFAKQLGYKKFWAYHKYQEAQGWKRKETPLLRFFDEENEPAPPRPPEKVMKSAESWLKSLRRINLSQDHHQQYSQKRKPQPISIPVNYLRQGNASQKAFLDVVVTNEQGEKRSVMVQGGSRERLMNYCWQVEADLYSFREDSSTVLIMTRQEQSAQTVFHHGILHIGNHEFEVTLMYSRERFAPELVIGQQKPPNFPGKSVFDELEL
jgi:superfamily II DNA or RNA helicase